MPRAARNIKASANVGNAPNASANCTPLASPNNGSCAEHNLGCQYHKHDADLNHHKGPYDNNAIDNHNNKAGLDNYPAAVDGCNNNCDKCSESNYQHSWYTRNNTFRSFVHNCPNNNCSEPNYRYYRYAHVHTCCLNDAGATNSYHRRAVDTSTPS